MASTYDVISTVTSSGSSSISFTSIPSTYTDLVLIFKGELNGGITKIGFNGDTATNYSSNIFIGFPASISGARYEFGWTFVIPKNSTISAQIINFFNYSNNTTFKTSLSRASSNNSTEQGIQLWRSTAAINRIDLINTGTYGSYTATLYGIKAK